MDKNHFDGKFFGTYYYASAIKNILDNQFEYLRNLDDFYGDDKYFYLTRPFQKYSAFHQFIEFVVRDIVFDEQKNVNLDDKKRELDLVTGIRDILKIEKPWELPIELEFREYGITYTSFRIWLKAKGKSFRDADEDDIYDYYDDLNLEGSISELVDKSVHEIFFILFQNRMVLLRYNEMISGCIGNSEFQDLPEDFKSYFTTKNRLKRQPIPKWAKRAVYFRDRGRCVGCSKDLSGILSLNNIENFDHIVPLALGGLNDISNLQLLCQNCNNIKSGIQISTSTKYETWYPISPIN